MKIRFESQGRWWEADLDGRQELAISQTFTTDQPNHFGVPLATRQPVQMGGFVGAVARGGGCNVDSIHLIPHCNGTHTESLSHILAAATNVPPLVIPPLFLSVLVSVAPVPAQECAESYRPRLEPTDRVVTRQHLCESYERARTAVAPPRPDNSPSLVPGLIVRTLPNSPSKRQARYGAEQQPCFFTSEAMEWIAASFEHLLVDVPSIDRIFDEGLLSNHHLFWRVPTGTHAATASSARHKTITELIYVPETIADGVYLLNLQTPAWATDAAPSRPLLFPVQTVTAP